MDLAQIKLPYTYKGYTIEEEVEFWPRKYGGPIRFYNADYSEVYHNAATIQEAMEQIDEGVNDYLPEGDAWSGGFAENH